MSGTLSAFSTPLDGLHLEALTSANSDQVNQLSTKPGQGEFVLPITYSLIVTPVAPGTAWQRVAVSRGRAVGYIQANLDPRPDVASELRACVWRVYVDAAAQSQGVGTFMFQSFAAAAHDLGIGRITVLRDAGEQRVADALHRIGFRNEGETGYGEIICALSTGA